MGVLTSLSKDAAAAQLKISTQCLDQLINERRIACRGGYISPLDIQAALRSNSFISRAKQIKQELVAADEKGAAAKHALANKRAELYQQLAAAKECGDYKTCSELHEKLAELNEAK